MGIDRTRANALANDVCGRSTRSVRPLRHSDRPPLPFPFGASFKPYCVRLERIVQMRMAEVDVKTANDVYGRFIEFEERAALIYLRLASRFSSDPKLSWFWFEMAMEEKQQAGLLQFCVTEGLLTHDLPSDDEVEQMSKLLSDLEQRATESQLTVDEAFSLAIEMESSEINAIYGRLTTVLHNSTYLLKRKIATLLPNHVDGLIAEARKFGVRNTLLREVIQSNKTPA